MSAEVREAKGMGKNGGGGGVLVFKPDSGKTYEVRTRLQEREKHYCVHLPRECLIQVHALKGVQEGH